MNSEQAIHGIVPRRASRWRSTLALAQHLQDVACDRDRGNRLRQNVDARPACKALIVLAMAREIEERHALVARGGGDGFAGLRAELEIEHGEVQRRGRHDLESRGDVGSRCHDRAKLGQTGFEVEADQRVVFDQQDPQAVKRFPSTVRVGHFKLLSGQHRGDRRFQGTIARICRYRKVGRIKI